MCRRHVCIFLTFIHNLRRHVFYFLPPPPLPHNSFGPSFHTTHSRKFEGEVQKPCKSRYVLEVHSVKVQIPSPNKRTLLVSFTVFFAVYSPRTLILRFGVLIYIHLVVKYIYLIYLRTNFYDLKSK